MRLVLIAGPSSSGKTTFSKRLGIQLLANGLRPFSLELDSYFVDREKTPRDEQGEYDYE
ncbi:MAG: nucleoside kinase, partial [Anaerolineae bacterium]|nr:nucleoside kinase [Anaerolineae bacterium]